MLFRKLPGVSASGMGLRLSQKFVFLLFLSGLVTLCFGALFFLPDSVRLKRIFLSKTDSPAVTAVSENGHSEHHKKGVREREQPRGMTPARGDAVTRLRAVSRRPSVTYEARTTGGKAQEERSQGRTEHGRAQDAAGAAKESASSGRGQHGGAFDYGKFKKCLLKPPLGTDQGDAQTRERRDKVKEVGSFINKINLLASIYSHMHPVYSSCFNS